MPTGMSFSVGGRFPWPGTDVCGHYHLWGSGPGRMRSRPVQGPTKALHLTNVSSEENVRIYYEIYYPNPYYTMFASHLRPYFPLYFVWFWNLSQLSWWIAPIMRFSVETAGACATFRCYIAMSTDVGLPPAGCCAPVEGGNRSRWSR